MDTPQLSDEFKTQLAQWAREAEKHGRHFLSRGYQGRVLLYESDEHRLVLKAPTPWWPYSWLSRFMLRHEARVYRQLAGLEGIPYCYGILGGRYLVLDFVEGPCLRDATFQDPEPFFEEFPRILRRMHAAGVGHGDLKRRDNILVGPDEKPWLIDFGIAVIRKRGFHPINSFLFNTARRFDLNAWVKHKYRGRSDPISPADQRYLRRTWMENIAGLVKRGLRRIIRRITGDPR
jgi:predicted Ser/Thr protein kinase